jgi:hypothetical protein
LHQYCVKYGKYQYRGRLLHNIPLILSPFSFSIFTILTACSQSFL